MRSSGTPREGETALNGFYASSSKVSLVVSTLKVLGISKTYGNAISGLNPALPAMI